MDNTQAEGDDIGERRQKAENAIKLLELMGYPKAVTDRAIEYAEKLSIT
jgi:hypothetical protein